MYGIYEGSLPGAIPSSGFLPTSTELLTRLSVGLFPINNTVQFVVCPLYNFHRTPTRPL